MFHHQTHSIMHLQLVPDLFVKIFQLLWWGEGGQLNVSSNFIEKKNEI